MSTLKEIRQARGLTLKEVAEKIHTSEVSISRYENEERRLTLPLLRKLADALHCSVAQLVGDEPFHREDEPRVEPIGTNMVRIDELDVRASAGSGQINDGETKIDEWQLPRGLVRTATNAPAQNIKIISVVGDSMTPTFNATDRVMVDIGDRRPSPPGVFVVWDGLGLVLKRVQFLAHSEPPRIKLTSDNAKYEPYERVVDEAHIQGRVLGKWLWT